MSRFDAFTEQELIELEDFRYYGGPATGVRDELSAEIDKRTYDRRAAAQAKREEENAQS